MQVLVRMATEADLDVLVALNQVVQSLHAALYPEDFGAVVDAAAVRTRFAALLHEPRNELVVAALDGSVVGYVWIERQVRPPSPFYHRRDRIYVHHLAVARDARRHGVAASLFRHVEQRAQAEGITDLYLESWADNRDAHAFFAAQGFTRLKVMFRKRLV
jgi:ribosomal protein S18 acetylase RimI-like enzyme